MGRGLISPASGGGSFSDTRCVLSNVNSTGVCARSQQIGPSSLRSADFLPEHVGGLSRSLRRLRCSGIGRPPRACGKSSASASRAVRFEGSCAGMVRSVLRDRSTWPQFRCSPAQSVLATEVFPVGTVSPKQLRVLFVTELSTHEALHRGLDSTPEGQCSVRVWSTPSRIPFSSLRQLTVSSSTIGGSTPAEAVIRTEM
jgi:hypothetical protein